MFNYWYVIEDGSWWDEETLVKDFNASNTSDIKGVILFQLIEDRKLKVERFPGMKGDEVSVFTDDAMIYER